MKKTLSVFATLALLFFGAACVPQETNTSETDEKGGKTETSNAPSVTIGADNISAVSVVLKGKANLKSSVSSDLSMGIMWSKNAGVLPSNSTKTEATNMDGDYNYSVGVTGLEPETTYYYRSYVTQNGQDTYGETKNFTTKDIASVLETKDATSVGATTATLNAKLDLTDVRYNNIAYGFYWGSSEQDLNSQINGGQIANNAFSASTTKLSHKTKYWYKAFVTLDNQSFNGDLKTLTTGAVAIEDISLNKEECIFHTIGEKVTLIATIIPEDATDKSIVWSSDNTEVATVNANGQVTAIGNGMATITATTLDQHKAASCTIRVAQYVTGISLDKPSLSLKEGEEETLTATVSPDNAADKTLCWSSSNEAIATIDQTGKVRAISKGSVTIRVTAGDNSGVFASCSVTVQYPCPPGAVDLGLSVYWATSNLSTSGLCANPEDFGDYYAWGETEPYYSSLDPLTWKDGKGRGYGYYASYIFFNSGFNKYNNGTADGTVDNKTVLDLEDDAAHANLDGNWRMPSYWELTELLDERKCTHKSTTENGVRGLKVTGKNGNSIFLPAAGYWKGNEIIIGVGIYWSSSLNTENSSQAIGLHSLAQNYRYEGNRCFGLPVRPVSTK